MASGRLAASGDTDDPRRLVRAVVVRHLGDGGDLVEVVRRRRRGRQPLESLATPRVRLRALAVPESDRHVDEDDEEAEPEERRTGRGSDVQRLEMLRELVVAARDSEVTEQELGNEGGGEAEEDQRRGHQPPSLRVHATVQHWEPGDEGGE